MIPDEQLLKPSYCLVSGGKDSLVSAQVLSNHDCLLGCVALDTGIQTPDWKDFVRSICKKKCWGLEIYKTPYNYDSLVEKFGFPGPEQHSMFMNYLKGRGIRQFKKIHPGSLLASGVRQTESSRRALTTKQFGKFEGIGIIAPIYNWPTSQVWKFFQDSGFERAPAYSTLQISGDCLCGAFAGPNEREAMEFHYPTIWERIKSLEIKLKHRLKRNIWGWANRKKNGQQDLFMCFECGDAKDETIK